VSVAQLALPKWPSTSLSVEHLGFGELSRRQGVGAQSILSETGAKQLGAEVTGKEGQSVSKVPAKMYFHF
jgi:hypothetical protein